MFRRRNPEQLLAMELVDRFARTYLITFALSYLAYPLVLMTTSTPANNSAGGGFIILIWLFGLPFAVKALVIGMIVSALTFFPTYKQLGKILPNRFAAPIAASIAAFFAVTFSVHTTFSVSPMAVSWAAVQHGYETSNSLGGLAAIIAAILARIVWIGADLNV